LWIKVQRREHRAPCFVELNNAAHCVRQALGQLGFFLGQL
jgi:hypothetical protein